MTTNLLFICSRNQWRSPTAEALFRKTPSYATRSRGTSKKAIRHVSVKDLQWADLIFVMERKHSQHLRAEFPEATRYKKPIVLGIPDEYRYMDPVLKSLLQEKVDLIRKELLAEKSKATAPDLDPNPRSEIVLELDATSS